jgi:hypothetical protein
MIDCEHDLAITKQAEALSVSQNFRNLSNLFRSYE